jgi:uncharacterized protein
VSIQSQIDALEGLSALDVARAELEAELKNEKAQLGDKHVHVTALQGKLDSISESLHQMERVRNELMSEARQTSVQMERSREKLGRSRTEREVNAAQREVEELRKLFRDRETEIQKLNALIDQAHEDAGSTRNQHDQLATEIGSSAGAIHSRVTELEQKVAQNLAARAAFSQVLPPVTFRKYETIRARRGNAVCHTTDGTCSVCHMSLAPMFFQVLRREHKLDQCPHCNRILYYKEPRPAEAASEPTVGES